MAHRRWVMGALCAWAATCAATRALADEPHPVTKQSQETTQEGYVVEVQGEDLVLDVGASQRLAVGQRVELWRPVSIKHPVTKKTMKDRFLIGELVISQVRPTISLARRATDLARDPQVGDAKRVRLLEEELRIPRVVTRATESLVFGGASLPRRPPGGRPSRSS